MMHVADTSPIHYLLLISHITVLPALYGRVVAPGEVMGELLHARAPASVRDWASAPPEWLEVMEPRRAFHRETALLDAGERAAIHLALELRDARLLMDERKGARAAQLLGVPVSGTLGILRDAHRAGIANGFACLDSLLSSTNFRLTGLVQREFLVSLHSITER